jgi:UTP-glucose-1-phosphate uridylyltransferase
MDIKNEGELNMQKPTLVIMAAGMGSRYGGLKQIEPIGPNGEIIMDYSIFDAVNAGFEKVVFIIKDEIEGIFKEKIGKKIEKQIKTEYAYQRIDNLPMGFSVPKGRVKPWGTGHAVLSCKGIVNEPFAVINADDYYGKESFKLLYDFLITPYFLPFVVDELIKEEKMDVKVLKTSDKWYGVTYKQDKEKVVNAIRQMLNQGKYPERLWNHE